MGIVINDGMISTEIVPRWGRWNTPFERSSPPRICRGLLSAKAAVNQIEKENKLRSPGRKSGNRDEFVQKEA